MTVAQSTRRQKPAKPRRDFPLFAHASGQWAKKVRGRLHYFGTWDDPAAAERLWDVQKQDLLAGRHPQHAAVITGELTVKHAVNEFLTSQELKVKSGKQSSRQFDDYLRVCTLIADTMGRDRPIQDVRPADFRALKAKLIERWKTPSGLRREMQNCRAMFRYAMRNGLVDRLIHFGDDFTPPGNTELRRHRQEQKRLHGERCFTVDQCRELLAHADPKFRAMILLALNCGCGNSDIRRLTDSDIRDGWLDLYRSKTANDRLAKLWPETIQAIEDQRNKKHANNPLIFVTKYGNSFGNGKSGGDPITQCFRKFLVRLDLYRPGLSFYALRHTYRTVADGCKDYPAVNLSMGHSDNSIAAVYREHIDPSRLEAVAAYVHQWLFKSGRKPR